MKLQNRIIEIKFENMQKVSRLTAYSPHKTVMCGDCK